ncbi:MAG: c-type cytochrome domain-containing protein [Gemmataceae bacterium]
MNSVRRSWSCLCLCTTVFCSTASLAADAPKVTYVDHVLPALRDKCIGCHNAEKTRGGLDMSTYFKLMEGGSSGDVVKPGDSDGSRLFLLAAHKAEPKMPPSGGKIADEALATIKKWIDGGALENSGSKAPLINKPKTDLALKAGPIGKPSVPPMPKARLALDGLKTPRPAAVTALAANPWSPLIAVASPRQVLLIHADTQDLIGVLPFSHGQVNVLKFSRNGGLLLAAGGRGGKSGKAVVWNVATGEKLFEVGDEHDAVLAADINPDQSQIALGGPSKIIRVYATADGALVREIKKHTDWVTAIEFSPDGKYLATADRSAGLVVWEAATGREHLGLRGHTLSVTDVSWRPDGQVLASGSEDGTVRLWEMENGKQLKSWGAHGGGVQSARYAMDGRIVTCGRDRVAKVWDATGNAIKAFEAFPDVAMRAVATHDSTRVIAGDWTGTLREWMIVDARRIGEFTTTPNSPADRLVVLAKDLTAKESALKQATEVLKTSKAAADKANQELAPAQKSAADLANIAKVVADAAVEAKAAYERAQGPVVAAQALVSARDIKAKVYSEAAAKLKDAAAKTPTSAELTQAAQQSQQLATQAATELAAAQKQLQDASTSAKAPTERWASVQKAVADTAGPAQQATAAAVAKAQAAKVANDSFASAKAVADKLTTEVNALRATIERLKGATVASR